MFSEIRLLLQVATGGDAEISESSDTDNNKDQVCSNVKVCKEM